MSFQNFNATPYDRLEGDGLLLGLEGQLERLKEEGDRGQIVLHRDYKCIVARGDDEPLGVLVWDETHKNQAWIYMSYVRPKYRRQGVWLKMWQALVDINRYGPIKTIGGGISINNAKMRAAAMKAGRTEIYVTSQFTYDNK